jgi:serine phosphatase RsbU (regulator of sigma subunit)/tetratricopeptide (TPR) repeat protein
MYLKEILLVLTCSIISNNILCNETDSSFLTLPRVPDTAKINILFTLCDKYQDLNSGLALKYAEKALQIAQKHNDQNKLTIALQKLGYQYNKKGDFSTAIDYYTKALKIADNIKNNQKIADLNHNLGATYIDKGDYQLAIYYLMKSLRIYDVLGDTISRAGDLLNIGLVFYYQNNYSKALEYYNKSLKLRREINDKRGIALLYNNIGIVYYFQNKKSKSIENFKNALALYSELNNIRGQSFPLYNIAEIYFEDNQYDSAFYYYSKSNHIDSLLNDKASLAKSLIKIAEVYDKKGQKSKALLYGHQALKIAIEVDSKLDIKDCYNILGEIYADINNYKEAFRYSELCNTIKDSIYSKQSTDAIAELQTKYETEKKDILLDKQKETIIHQHTVSLLLIYGLLSIIGFAITVFIFYSQKKKAFTLLKIQKQSITDSINYASRIQTALLPPQNLLNDLLPEHFVLYLPRDVVSGDFYWITLIDDKTILAVADCTGHGVPGAFMSMLGFAFLNEIVKISTALKANEILNELRKKVINALHQNESSFNRDGMDIAIAIIDKKNKTLQFSGANNPLIIVRNSEIINVSADKMPIGTHAVDKESFTLHELELNLGDTVYMFTDGYIDQFGGLNGKRFGKIAFEKLLLQSSELQIKAQRYFLEEKLLIWMENTDQLDDILIMGVKIK